MLEKIIIDGYKTFINPTSIDFKATNYKILDDTNVGDNRILKGALFIGENASGKTNILNSITLLLDMLFSSKNINLLTSKSFYNTRNSFKIEYDFICNDKSIKYIYELGNNKDGSNKIFNEKLVYDNNDIINRIGNNATFTFNNETKTFEDVSPQLLFLRRVYFDTRFYDDETLNKWMDYMKNSIYINCYNSNLINYNGDSNISIHNYLKDNDVKEINEFFKKINYRQLIEYSDHNTDPNNIFSVKSADKFISFNKEGTDIYIPEMFESRGNITLINILPSFLYATKHECMLILDEFSSGLHNELEEILIKFFNTYSSNSQMFFASHSTNILNTLLLRPDQIYAVNFHSNDGSIIKRFSEEMPRESQNIEKMYLNGVFDGMPHYNKIFKDKSN